jgi:Pyruvate/2-oxoacid:ferredoxin oxidoreductase delta subunit
METPDRTEERRMAEHKFLAKPPKRLAVVDQNSCSGCAGSPACVTYCETVTVKEKVVDAIRTVAWPGSPFELAVVEYDKCIGCAICVAVCPWDAITMYSYEEGLKVAPELTLVYHEEPEGEATAAVPSVTEEASGS